MMKKIKNSIIKEEKCESKEIPEELWYSIEPGDQRLSHYHRDAGNSACERLRVINTNYRKNQGPGDPDIQVRAQIEERAYKWLWSGHLFATNLTGEALGVSRDEFQEAVRDSYSLSQVLSADTARASSGVTRA